MAKKQALTVQGIEVRLSLQKENDFICITDIAKGFEVGVSAIESWMRNRNTIEFLGMWEQLYNTQFNSVGFDGIKGNVGLNTFKISVKKWIKETKAIGLHAKAGRYGGTFAHKDIAIQFCYWLSPTFQLYLIKEFQRLKEEEAKKLHNDWNVHRLLTKANFHIQTTAVREHLVPVIDWHTKREAIRQASETDLLNIALFGQTAREWKRANPKKKGNMRDHASSLQLLVLANLQSLNAKLIEWDSSRDQRLQFLNETARQQIDILVNTKSAQELESLAATSKKLLGKKRK